jgi:hypothetical protein
MSSLNTEVMAINFLTLEQYHGICAWSLFQYRRIIVSYLTTVNLGAVVAYSSNPLEDPVRIAHLPNVKVYMDRWEISGDAVGECMKDGWTRYFTLFFGWPAALIEYSKFSVQRCIE